MLNRTLQLLKKNSVIVLFYFLYLAVTFLIFFLLYPWNLYQMTDTTNLYAYSSVYYITAIAKMFVAMGLLFILGLLFSSGYGYMVSEAVLFGKTSASSFVQGIKIFFVRVLLLMLLMMGISFAFSIIISIITIPLMFIFIMIGVPAVVTLMITFLIMAILIFALPFALLWIPAIFIDNTGIIDGLKSGVKAGAKNYGKLILLIVSIYLPIFLYMVLNINSIANGRIYSVGFFVLLIIESIISVVIMPLIFIIYFDYRQKMNGL